jgi:hypothetical protein
VGLCASLSANCSCDFRFFVDRLDAEDVVEVADEGFEVAVAGLVFWSVDSLADERVTLVLLRASRDGDVGDETDDAGE